MLSGLAASRRSWARPQGDRRAFPVAYVGKAAPDRREDQPADPGGHGQPGDELKGLYPEEGMSVR
jgi:hypothetical protein